MSPISVKIITFKKEIIVRFLGTIRVLGYFKPSLLMDMMKKSKSRINNWFWIYVHY